MIKRVMFSLCMAIVVILIMLGICYHSMPLFGLSIMVSIIAESAFGGK